MSHYRLPAAIRKGLRQRKNFTDDGTYISEGLALLQKISADSQEAVEKSENLDIRGQAQATIDVLKDGVLLFASLAARLGIAPTAPAPDGAAPPDPMEAARRRFGL